mmetsp:Transcript_37906/g.109353  ORF Transcript_37906/g.109353 Transcript_37906/m.109353 type:complete len:260 (+) Transcript_37906:40-819(+)
MEGENTPKAVLRPRRPGESLKVAQTVLKRRDRNLKAAADRAAQIAKIRVAQKEYKKGKLRIIRAETVVRNAMTKMADKRRIRIARKKEPEPKLQAESNTVVIVRNGRLGGSRETKQALREMGLPKRNTLIFAPNTREVAKKLQTVKPFAFWGRANFKVIFNLVHKKAMFKDPEDPKSLQPLSDNALIEKHLGALGVLCTEDLAHILFTNGKHFKEVNERLWPFRLGELRKAGKMVHEKKFTYGNLGSGINQALRKLVGE